MFSPTGQIQGLGGLNLHDVLEMPRDDSSGRTHHIIFASCLVSSQSIIVETLITSPPPSCTGNRTRCSVRGAAEDGIVRKFARGQMSSNEVPHASHKLRCPAKAGSNLNFPHCANVFEGTKSRRVADTLSSPLPSGQVRTRFKQVQVYSL